MGRRRRDFVNHENHRLGAFLDGALDPDRGNMLVGWGRTYRCACGFRCRAPGAIYDHTRGCGTGQRELFAPTGGDGENHG